MVHRNLIMKRLPIILGIARSSGDTSSGGRASQKGSGALTAEHKQKIFERDNHTCQCCGFYSKKYQDVHFINGNYADQSEKNMVTTCIFCHQCFNLDKVNTMRSGVLVWLPEIGQAELHHIARAIYVARISQGPVAEAARRGLDILMKRREEARNRIGVDDPMILATVLQDYISPAHYKQRQQKLDGLRLFPLDRRIIQEADLQFNQFPQILAYWRSKDGPFGGKTPKDWLCIFKQAEAA